MDIQTKAFVRVQLKNLFSLAAFFEDFKGGRKKILKNIGYIFLTVYMVVVFGGMMGVQSYALYTGFKPLGMQSICLETTFFTALFLSFFFGFLHALSTYIISSSEETLLALPAQPIAYLAGKWLSSYLFQLPFVMLVVLVGCGVYGWFEKLLLSPLFYITVVFGGLSIPLIPYCLIYLILVAVFNLGKGLRIKKILHLVSSVVMIVVVIAVTQEYSRSMNFIGDPEKLRNMYMEGGVASALKSFSWYTPMGWFVAAVRNASANPVNSTYNLLLFVLISVIATRALMRILAPAYRKSIVGFDESSAKKMKASETDEFIKKDIRSSSVFKSLLKRDFNNMIREPAFFINGPFMIILLPVIFGISFYFALPKDSLNNLISSFRAIGTDGAVSQLWFWITAIASFAGIFLGSMSGVGATCFSREGKGLQILKAMPVDPVTLAAAKIAHVDIYSVFSAVIADAAVVIFFGMLPVQFSIPEILFSLLLITLISICGADSIQIVDMFIDTANPKLDWENPHQAVKQNMNAVIGVFLPMGIIALFVVAVIFLPRNRNLITGIFIVTIVLRELLLRLYKKYLSKRYYTM